MERSEEREIARRAMESLTGRDRSFLLMREDGSTYDHIAERMGVDRESVGTTLARARKRLSDRYEVLKRARETAGSGVA